MQLFDLIINKIRIASSNNHVDSGAVYLYPNEQFHKLPLEFLRLKLMLFNNEGRRF